ncbi:hypothetical protein DCO58_04715 [Helicobacter saguini]|uniref:Uncharacterized protein n=1 Tax=Helicobacter saguini TaxID=1548018 RepID=A0A347VSV8_9HELI|nr:hypothetical protein [Helicobacter saguini]MWV62345.1 hypothetical protein [Helicobacter saguini]MWV66984.1 hypothetical protein [Helicobacter saguini]MWV69332.1 hypothetical protein [Helicobacter saguini]MWV71113.1 hypothetical protein [Helicobacter saguini]TLD94992.1 hypothetical protein LS64_003480 [Helicobacter saguini]
MKTFKDLLNSTQFTQRMVNYGYCTNKLMNFILNSNALQPLLHFLPLSVKNNVLAIFPSKRNKNEILICLKSQPACVEFNKYHAKEMINLIQTNRFLPPNLKTYTKITAYVPTNRLYTSKIVQIRPEKKLIESARGNFRNLATDAKIHAIFEEIRQVAITNQRKLERLNSQKIDSNPIDYKFQKTRR